MPPFQQRYNDDFRGWPVSPQHRAASGPRHVSRPAARPRRSGAIYHTGVDVAVRDDRPEQGAPPAGRTASTRSRAASSRRRPSPASAATSASATSATATSTRASSAATGCSAGQFIGWTTKGSWHVHLTEFHSPATVGRCCSTRSGPGGKLKPYADTAPPVIHDVRFYTPATPTWGRRVTGVAQLPPAGTAAGQVAPGRSRRHQGARQRPAVLHRLVQATSRCSPRRTTRTGSACC